MSFLLKSLTKKDKIDEGGRSRQSVAFVSLNRVEHFIRAAFGNCTESTGICQG